MSSSRRTRQSATLAALAIAALVVTQCSGSSTSPSSSPALATVALNATSVAAGGTAQGTLTLTAQAPAGGSSVTLSSNNPSVATVASPVTIPAGASSAPFTVTTVGVGTATITGSMNGTSRQSPMLTVTAGPALSALTVSAPSVVGGNLAIGTAMLSAAAPAGGALVSLSTSSPAAVPASVTVPAGLTSMTFTITTGAVGSTAAVTINGSYAGTSASVLLTVTPPAAATANFGVTGPTETETCTLANGGNTIDCTFNGSTSTAPGTIVAWDWSYGVATMFTQTTAGPVLAMPTVNCSVVPAPPLPAAGPAWFTMTVTLKVHDSLGNVSAEAVHNDVRLFPQGTCGF